MPETPLPATGPSLFWHLPALVLAVSVVYSATRFENRSLIAYYTVRWAVYIVSFLAGIGVLIWLLSLHLADVWYWILGVAVLFFMFRDNVVALYRLVRPADDGNPKRKGGASHAG